jgi:hypothetical protein
MNSTTIVNRLGLLLFVCSLLNLLNLDPPFSSLGLHVEFVSLELLFQFWISPLVCFLSMFAPPLEAMAFEVRPRRLVVQSLCLAC